MNDNRFIMDSGQNNGTTAINEEYNSQNNSDFIYVNNDESYQQANKGAGFLSKINTKLILIIGLVLLFLLFVIIMIVSFTRKDKDSEWLDKIIKAGETYVSEENKVEKGILDGDRDKIYFFELLDGNYISNADLVYPVTGETLTKCNYIVVTVGSNNQPSYDEVTTNNPECPEQNPVITLNGETDVEVTQGVAYSDLGATAVDWDETDLTSKIVTTGTVDTTKPGSYTITYNVDNSLGNSATTVARTVVVIAKPVVVPPTPKPTPTPSVDRTRPVIRATGLPKTIKVGQTAYYSFNYSDNVKLKSITYCSTTCKTENIYAKSKYKSLSFYGSKAGVYTIKASAVDTRGNSASYSSKIIVNAVSIPDTIVPKIIWENALPLASRTVKAGSYMNIRIKITDNVAVREYVACLGSVCSQRSVTPSTTVIVPISATLNVPGEYPITALAKDTSGNYTGNKYLGKIIVIK